MKVDKSHTKNQRDKNRGAKDKNLQQANYKFLSNEYGIS